MSDCRWISFCMDSSKIWCATGNGVGTADVLSILMISGTKYHLICRFLLMIVYFIELLHDSILEWSRLWQMNFIIRKCTVLQCYRTSFPILANYSLASQILECVKEHSYLGIILDQQMIFTSHINHIVSKATKVLNFLKRNLHKCSTSTKATTYISLVRPILEYASSVWDPYQYNKIYIIDRRIQRRAARWS